MDKEKMTQHASELLRKAGIRQSHQRIAILCYLMTHDTHPSAEDIYDALHLECPSMSLTTVYNTLKTLSDAGAINLLRLESERAHFDFPRMRHAHFRCRRCGRIFDMPMVETTPCCGNDFQVDSVEIYYHGICPDCKNKNQ
ncbi:MAG: Fur family transcriptional regulator [Candidatus Limimorpha sp.]